MKTGRSLVALATEIENQATAKKDIVADTQVLTMTPQSELVIENYGDFQLNNHTHQQIAQKIDIPWKYYQRMKGFAPSLLADNVNHWFKHNNERRMVRTLGTIARAFLSDRYCRIDHIDLLQVVLPEIKNMGGAQICSCEITDSRLYLKVLNPKLEAEVRKDDIVQAGFCLSNSEIGLGSVAVEPLIYRLVCTNGMICQDFSQKRRHVGRASAETDSAYELYSQETLAADDSAFMLKVRDTVRAAVDEAQFHTIVKSLREATEKRIEGNPVESVKVLENKYSLSESESSGVLTHLIQSSDLTAYGLANAVTRTAQDVPDYDRATDLERLGSQILKLSASTWKEIATAK